MADVLELRADARSAEELLTRVHHLRELIERRAADDENATQISNEVIAALENAGVFELMAPRELGGVEAHPLMVFEVLKALAYFDGSTGWYCQAATTGVAVAGSMLGPQAIDAIFRSGERATCAGQAAPTGRAERVGEGYRISGSYSFGSGLPNARWVVGGYILHDQGKPVLGPSGEPTMLIAIVPRGTVELRGNWDVLGLRGTGSYDFHVTEQWVHEDFVFAPGAASARRGGALYTMGFLAIPTLCHASWAAGCAWRLLDEWGAHAQAKKKPTGALLSDMATFRRDFAAAHGQVRAAEAYVRQTYEQLFEAARAGAVPPELVIDSKLCASNMVSVGVQVAQAAFTSSATTGLRNGSVLQRCFRDMQAANAHFLTAEQSFIDIGGELLANARP